jgi:hypothetical protein
MEQSEVVRRAIEAVRAICEAPHTETIGQREPRREAVWPPESEAAIKRFHGQLHARLFPFIGHKVRTPQGPGTLLQVFEDRATVLLDSERDGACVRFLPCEISPVAAHDAYA